MARTLTNHTGRDQRRGRRLGPYFVRLLDYERPQAAGSRHDLDGLAEVAIGRGDAAWLERRRDRLELLIEDPRASERHARLAFAATGWEIEDLGSRNGTFLDGERVTRAALRDGSIFEIGRNAFLFRIGELADLPDADVADLAMPLPGIATLSVPFERALASAALLARSTQSVVLHGETGTGKEVVARAIHTASGRSGAFVAVNCAALPATLTESELFGFRKGAFSGAVEDRPGLVRGAHGGTLFLDEIGDLPLATQGALLRVLQEREVLPVGANQPIAVDVRVLAASHRDLEREVSEGRFREDLLARLSGFVVAIPPLRERREDLGLLVATLLRGSKEPRTIRFAPAAGLALARYLWPRNVRELEQALTTAIALALDGIVAVEHLPAALRSGADPRSHGAPGESIRADDLSPSELRRREQIRTLLANHHGNIAAVARAMGVARMQVQRWLRQYAIDVAAFRKR